MAVIPAADRARIAAKIHRTDLSEGKTYTKPDLVQAVADTDAWVDAAILTGTGTVAVYNQGLSAGIRSKFTTAQKALILYAVIQMKLGTFEDVG